MHLNVIQLAESFGVEESVVEGWVRNESLPAIEDRGRWLFDRAQVIAWATERGLAAKAGFLAQPRVAAAGVRSLESLLRTGGISRDVPASEILNVLERVVAALPGATTDVRKILTQRLRASGGVNWAPVGGGFALPHLRTPITLGRDSGLLAILLLRDPLLFEESPLDDVPITRLLFFIAPSPRAHLDILAQLSTALSRGRLRDALTRNAAAEEIFDSLGPVPAPAKGSELKS